MSEITDSLEKGWLRTVLNDVQKESELVAEVQRLQEQVRVLREALAVTQQEFCNWVCEARPEHTEECGQARAALAATEERP